MLLAPQRCCRPSGKTQRVGGEVLGRAGGNWGTRMGTPHHCVPGRFLTNCCFQFLVTDWLCHLDPVVPLLLGSLGPSLPPVNVLGGAGPSVVNPGCRKGWNIPLSHSGTQT